jgi:UPF0755 protein
LRWFAVPLLAIGGAASGWVAWQHALNRPGPLTEARAVVVPRASVGEVADTLRHAGVIAAAEWFRVAVWLSRQQGPLHAAELEFPAHGSLREVLVVLRTSRPVQHHITIAEGLTGRQIAAVLDRAEAASGKVAIPVEGDVLPQTYDYEYGTPRRVILGRANAALERALSTAWAGRAPGLPLAGPREALILASIVERETARPDERAHVAAVYLNRLRLGMRLEADPTVAYAATIAEAGDTATGVAGGAAAAGPSDHALTRHDLERDDPFNTYRHAGLPPGPICAPGLASILAVLHPAASDDLYFVADGTGGHAFARTLEAHARNVAHWRALSTPRGSPD